MKEKLIVSDWKQCQTGASLMIFFFFYMDGLGEIGAFTLVKVQFSEQLHLKIFLSVFPQGYLHIFPPQLVQDWDHVKLTKHLFPLTQFCDRASPQQRLPLGVFWPRLHLGPPVAPQVPVAASASNTGRISDAARSRGVVTSIKSILTLY